MVTTLVKVVVLVALLVVVAHDGFSIARTQITVRDDAAQTAQVGLDALQTGSTQKQAYQKVVDYAKAHGATVVPGSFSVGKGPSVTVTITETAPTMVAGRLGFFSDAVTPRSTGTASHSSL